MHHPTLFSVATAAALLASLPAQAAPEKFRVQRLEALNAYMPGNTYVTALNDRGQITGGSDFGDPGAVVETAYLYGGGELRRLVNGATPLLGAGIDINDRGDIVGINRGDGGRMRPFLYRNGTLLDLGGSLEGSLGWASSINERGQVTGRLGDRAFIYDGQTSRFIGALGFTYSSGGQAINDRGMVAGYLTRARGARAVGFVYQPGQVTLLRGQQGRSILPSDINNAGQVVGASVSAQEGLNAFLYSDGAMTDLGPVASTTVSINEAGWIVGTALNADSSTDGFLYRDGAMHRLDDLLTPGAAGRWDVLYGAALSDRGQIVVGAQDAQGRLNHLLLSPVPEPASTALLLAGLGVVGWVARRRR